MKVLFAWFWCKYVYNNDNEGLSLYSLIKQVQFNSTKNSWVADVPTQFATDNVQKLQFSKCIFTLL